MRDDNHGSQGKRQIGANERPGIRPVEAWRGALTVGWVTHMDWASYPD
ncbi:MAG: hypothetical protein AAF913_14815 [Pseudomonadota bacterium]